MNKNIDGFGEIKSSGLEGIEINKESISSVSVNDKGDMNSVSTFESDDEDDEIIIEEEEKTGLSAFRSISAFYAKIASDLNETEGVKRVDQPALGTVAPAIFIEAVFNSNPNQPALLVVVNSTYKIQNLLDYIYSINFIYGRTLNGNLVSHNLKDLVELKILSAYKYNQDGVVPFLIEYKLLYSSYECGRIYALFS